MDLPDFFRAQHVDHIFGNKFSHLPDTGQTPDKDRVSKVFIRKSIRYRMLISSIMVQAPSFAILRYAPKRSCTEKRAGWAIIVGLPHMGHAEKGYRYDLRRSDGFSRSLTFPGLGFFYEFAFAACFFKDSNCGVGCFLKRFFCFLVIGCCHLDPVDRCTQVQQTRCLLRQSWLRLPFLRHCV